MSQYDKSFDQGNNFFHICWGYLGHLKLCCNIFLEKKSPCDEKQATLLEIIL